MKKSVVVGLSSVLMIGVLLLINGCGDAGDLAKHRSPSYVIINKMVPSVLNSDVCNTCSGAGTAGVCTVQDDSIVITMTAKSLNFEPPTAPVDTRFLDVMLEHYSVRYVRTDSGKAVPATYTENCNMYLAIDGSVDVPVRTLRAEQKTMVPLSYLNTCNAFGYEPETGLYTINCTAVITFYGKTISGNSLSWTANLPVTFADYAAQ